MIAYKKADSDDIESIIHAIIRLTPNINKNITKNEIDQYIDHAYYLIDTDSNLIVGFVCAQRVDRVNDELVEHNIGTNCYVIPYFVIDNNLVGSDHTIRMLKELLVDMRDFPVYYLSDIVPDDDARSKALRWNNFKYFDTFKAYVKNHMQNNFI